MTIAGWQPPERDLVRDHTSAASNRRIDEQTAEELATASEHPDSVRERLAELDREWTIDRVLMLNFAVLGGLSATLAMRSLVRTGRLGGWGALFFTQIGFLAHHAIRSWCPPMPVFRRLGFRSAREICAERVALEKLLRE